MPVEADAPQIEVTMFDTPSGNVRGMVNTFITIKGKQKRVAHATLLVGDSPTIAIDVPKALQLDQIATITQALNAFEAKVRELDAAATAQD